MAKSKLLFCGALAVILWSKAVINSTAKCCVLRLLVDIIIPTSPSLVEHRSCNTKLLRSVGSAVDSVQCIHRYERFYLFLSQNV